MSGRIKGITFDLWDTIIDDDSDEPKRATLGLRPKVAHRRHVIWDALNKHQPIEYETVELAYDTADAAFNRVWKENHITWPIGHRIDLVLQGLGRSLPDADYAEVVRASEEMEIEVPPDMVPGADEAIAQLAGRYKLCILSDTVVSPARCLRELLDKYGVLQHFTGFCFSDEVGRSKPHSDGYESAARQMDLALSEMIHVGDREALDVKGAHAMGMKAILFTATRDLDKDNTAAEAICERHADLPAIVDRLAALD